MFKRIRDFIYDINDIFIALVIILVAVGIIVWRSTTIMAYPEYLAAKAEAQANTYSPIEGPPQIITNTVTPEGNTTENNAGTTEGQGGETQTDQSETQSTEGQPQGGEGTEGQQTTVVTADITIEFGFRGNWYTVADRIIEAGVLQPEDRNPFYNTVVDLGLGPKLQIGTFTLSSDMSYEQMIKILCNQ